MMEINCICLHLVRMCMRSRRLYVVLHNQIYSISIHPHKYRAITELFQFKNTQIRLLPMKPTAVKAISVYPNARERFERLRQDASLHFITSIPVFMLCWKTGPRSLGHVRTGLATRQRPGRRVWGGNGGIGGSEEPRTRASVSCHEPQVLCASSVSTEGSLSQLINSLPWYVREGISKDCAWGGRAGLGSWRRVLWKANVVRSRQRVGAEVERAGRCRLFLWGEP